MMYRTLCASRGAKYNHDTDPRSQIDTRFFGNINCHRMRVFFTPINPSGGCHPMFRLLWWVSSHVCSSNQTSHYVCASPHHIWYLAYTQYAHHSCLSSLKCLHTMQIESRVSHDAHIAKWQVGQISGGNLWLLFFYFGLLPLKSIDNWWWRTSPFSKTCFINSSVEILTSIICVPADYQREALFRWWQDWWSCCTHPDIYINPDTYMNRPDLWPGHLYLYVFINPDLYIDCPDLWP